MNNRSYDFSKGETTIVGGFVELDALLEGFYLTLISRVAEIYKVNCSIDFSFQVFASDGPAYSSFGFYVGSKWYPGENPPSYPNQYVTLRTKSDLLDFLDWLLEGGKKEVSYDLSYS